MAESLCLLDKSTITKKRDRPSSANEIDASYEEKKKRGPTKPIPQFDVSRDNIRHFPIEEKPNWGLKTFFKSVKCNMYLCILKKRNCFITFLE